MTGHIFEFDEKCLECFICISKDNFILLIVIILLILILFMLIYRFFRK